MHNFEHRKIDGGDFLNVEVIQLENDEGFACRNRAGQVEHFSDAEVKVLNPSLHHRVDPHAHVGGVAGRRATTEAERMHRLMPIAREDCHVYALDEAGVGFAACVGEVIGVVEGERGTWAPELVPALGEDGGGDGGGGWEERENVRENFVR